MAGKNAKTYRSLRDTDEFKTLQKSIHAGVVKALADTVKTQEYARFLGYLRNEITAQATREMVKDGQVDRDEQRILHYLDSTRILDDYAKSLLEQDLLDVLYLGLVKTIQDDDLETSEEARAKEYLRKVFGITRERAEALEDRYHVDRLLGKA